MSENIDTAPQTSEVKEEKKKVFQKFKKETPFVAENGWSSKEIEKNSLNMRTRQPRRRQIPASFQIAIIIDIILFGC